MISAIFLPTIDDPEMRFCDLQITAMQAIRAGLRLYTDGTRWALLPKPLPGWMLFIGGLSKCAA